MSKENELPDSWVITKLGDIASPGGTWNPGISSESEFFYVDIESVDNKTQRIVAPKRLPVAEAPSRARMAIRTGDVIFSLVRPYLKNIAIVPSELDGQVASTAYCVMRPETSITSSYIFYAVLRQSFIDSIKTYGNSPPSAHDDEFFTMEIPLAPTNEQHRIVAAIEQQFSRLDAAVTSLQHARAKLKRQRAAILKAAVEGTLTADWRAQQPASETAEQLLQRILRERRAKWEAEQLTKMQAKGVTPKDDKWKDAYKEPESPDITNLPELPEGWCWTTLDELSYHITSGSRGWAQYYANSGSLFIRVGNFNRLSTKIDLQNAVFVRAPDSLEADRCRLQIGDLLITITADVGMIGVADEGVFQWGQAFINQHVGLIRFIYPELTTAVALALMSEAMQTQIKSKQYGATKIGLGLEDIRSLTVPLSPLAEQAQIVSEVEARLSIIAQTELEVVANLKRAERLRQAILAEAFAGRLVPQHPHDEPASVLLERIRQQREERDETQKKGKTGNGRARATVKVSDEPVKIDMQGVEQEALWESVGG